GADTTGVRPGVIGEIGVEKAWVSPSEERVHRAAARAQRATGLPLVTHGLMSPVALQQLAIFEEEGVDLTRVAVGHCDSYPHLKYQLSLMERGVMLMFDNLGGVRDTGGRMEERIIGLICSLLDSGYADRLLLSQDICKTTQLRYQGGIGYTYIAETFLPRLEEAGVTRDQIQQMTVDNPRRWLAGAGSC